MRGVAFQMTKGHEFILTRLYRARLDPPLPAGIYPVESEQVSVYRDQICIREGFIWSASGPTLDTPDTMRASLVHDALYALIRCGGLDKRQARKVADRNFYRLLREDGTPWWRASLWYRAVRMAGRVWIGLGRP